METYRQLASLSYLTVLLGGLVWGAREAALRPESLLLLRYPRHRNLWLFAASLIAISAAFAAAAIATGYKAERFWAFVMSSIMGLLAAAACAPGVARLEDSVPRQPINYRIFAAVAVVVIAWSFTSMELMQWLMGLVAGHAVEVKALDDGIGPLFDNAPPLALLSLAALVLVGAIQEEVLFRGALQSNLATTPLGPQGAVVVASLLWALAHGSSYIDPPGLKETQIFGLGLLFGTMRERYGLKASVALHILNNGLVMVLFPFMPK